MYHNNSVDCKCNNSIWPGVTQLELSVMNRWMSLINSSDAFENGSMVKKPCCSPSNSANSTLLPHALSFAVYSRARSLRRSAPPITTRIGSNDTDSRLVLAGPNGFENEWSVSAPSGRESLQNLRKENPVNAHDPLNKV